MEILNKILHSYAIYSRKEMVKVFKCYLIPKKSYDTLSKGAIFWPTLYILSMASWTIKILIDLDLSSTYEEATVALLFWANLLRS